MTSKIAFIFPGQGAQSLGMGKTFYDNNKEAREIFDEASEVLAIDMARLCFEENDQLHITEYTQPAILTATVAILKGVEKSCGIRPDVVAGLSLGEYSALVANQSIQFADAVRTVRKRGKYMQEAVPIGAGTMAAILGLETEIIEKTCRDIGEVELANYNCPGQVVISGKTHAVEAAIEQLQEKGAKRALKLKVSGPFHSSMLRPAGEALARTLEDVVVRTPYIPYLANVTGDYVKDADEIKPLLIQQVSSSVKWQQTIETMIAEGVMTFVEIGPGKTLSGFVKKIDRNKQVINIETTEDLKKLEGVVVC